MIEIKSKKTGRIQVVSEEEFKKMDKILNRFTWTRLTLRPMIPSMKEPPLEIKKPKPKV